MCTVPVGVTNGYTLPSYDARLLMDKPEPMLLCVVTEVSTRQATF